MRPRLSAKTARMMSLATPGDAGETSHFYPGWQAVQAAAIGPHPERIVAALGDGPDMVAEQALGAAVGLPFPVLEPDQAAADRADPHAALAVFEHRPHRIHRQAVARAVEDEFFVLQLNEPVAGADPQAAFAVFQDGARRHQPGQALAHDRDPAVLQAVERFLVGADPQHPVAVLVNGADIGWTTAAPAGVRNGRRGNGSVRRRWCRSTRSPADRGAGRGCHYAAGRWPVSKTRIFPFWKWLSPWPVPIQMPPAPSSAREVM